MWLLIWLTMFGFAVLTTATWAILETRIPMATTSSAFAWMWLFFRGSTIETHSAGVTFQQDLSSLVWFYLFMGVLNLAGLLLWYFGDFPEDESRLEQAEVT